MAEKEVEPTPEHEEETSYKAPKYESVDALLQKDADDESLRKYKETLLGSQTNATRPFPNDDRTVIISELALISKDRDDIVVALEGDKAAIQKKLKEQAFTIKEGASFNMRIKFYVNQNEIVSGLKYVQKTSRKGIQVDKDSYMMGSYRLSEDINKPNIFNTPVEDAPKGMLARGDYTVKSQFVDDDKNCHLEWEWKFKISKEWE